VKKVELLSFEGTVDVENIKTTSWAKRVMPLVAKIHYLKKYTNF
jgi:hypothetical protein